MKRLDRGGGYETLITRDDGAVYLLRGVGDRLSIPHDLAHHVVEQTLGLERGFWGTIAAGAVFATMHYRSGWRAPKGAQRSRALLLANARPLDEAEALVRWCADCSENGQAAGVTTGGVGEGYDAAQSAAVIAAYHAAMMRWRDTGVGCALDLRWG